MTSFECCTSTCCTLLVLISIFLHQVYHNERRPLDLWFSFLSGQYVHKLRHSESPAQKPPWQILEPDSIRWMLQCSPCWQWPLRGTEPSWPRWPRGTRTPPSGSGSGWSGVAAPFSPCPQPSPRPSLNRWLFFSSFFTSQMKMPVIQLGRQMIFVASHYTYYIKRCAKYVYFLNNTEATRFCFKATLYSRLAWRGPRKVGMGLWVRRQQILFLIILFLSKGFFSNHYLSK